MLELIRTSKVKQTAVPVQLGITVWLTAPLTLTSCVHQVITAHLAHNTVRSTNVQLAHSTMLQVNKVYQVAYLVHLGGIAPHPDLASPQGSVIQDGIAHSDRQYNNH